MRDLFIPLILAASLLVAGCVGNPQTTTTQTTATTEPAQVTVKTTQTTVKEAQAAQTTTSDMGAVSAAAGIDVLVLDKETRRPVEGVLVFIGNGFKDCVTDGSGQCSIVDFPWGSYSLSAFKKGYYHYTNSSNFKKGGNSLTVEVERQTAPAQSFRVKGALVDVVAAKGTMSENHYLKVKGDGGEYYLFNKYGRNEGFEGYIGKTVRVLGYTGVGAIGWQWQKTEGIYVEEIAPV